MTNKPIITHKTELQPGFDLGEDKDFLVYIRHPTDRLQQLSIIGWVKHSYGQMFCDYREVYLDGEDIAASVIKAILDLKASYADLLSYLKEKPDFSIGTLNRIDRQKVMLPSGDDLKYSQGWEGLHAIAMELDLPDSFRDGVRDGIE